MKENMAPTTLVGMNETRKPPNLVVRCFVINACNYGYY